MLKFKRAAALFVARCLLACGAFGAAAEQPAEDVDVIADLLNYFLGAGEQEEAAPEQNENAESYADPDDYVEGEEEYVFDSYEDEEEIEVEKHLEIDDLSVTPGLPEAWLNILLLGSDARGSTKFLRTDTMIIMSINATTNEVKLTSVMRDIWIDLPEYGGQKLNAACVYGGPELTMRMINEYFGMNIRYYALVNMKCLVSIVDALGGLRLDVSGAESRAISKLSAEDAQSPNGESKFATSVPAGKQVLLNGKQVLAYSRIRKSDSDYARTRRQRTVLVALAKRLQQESLFSLAGILTNLLQYVTTNMGFDQILAIAKTCMGVDLENLDEFRLPVDDTYTDGMAHGVWCIEPDFEENARQLYAFIYE